MVESVDDEGAPQSQTEHWVAFWVDGKPVQTPDLSQGCQLWETADVGFQEDQMLSVKKKNKLWFSYNKRIMGNRMIRVAALEKHI